MIITKMHLSRRAVLRGLGATLALPFLDSMVPAFTALAQTAAAPVRRFGVFYVPNGMSMPYWFPKTPGPLAELPPTLRSLTELKDRVLLMGGLADEAANLVRASGDHARSAGTFLTGVPFSTGGSEVRAGVSVDQIAARETEKATQLSSLELGIESNAMVGSCDGGASCAYTNTVAWRNPTTPLPMENQPRAVFERLFGDSDNTTKAARLARIQDDRSVLDSLIEEVQRMRRRLGPSDTGRLSQYLDAIRDIERRIQKAEQQIDVELPAMERPSGGIPSTFGEHARLMFDLQVLAFQCDMTRVTTFLMSREVSPRTYTEIGIPDPHHGLSHHQNNAASMEKLAKINTYHIQQLAYFLEKMQATPDGDGTLLDRLTLLYGCGISDSNRHTHDNLPILVVGGAGSIKGGRHVRVPPGTPLTNLQLTLLERVGVPLDGLGDSTGRVNLVTGV